MTAFRGISLAGPAAEPGLAAKLPNTLEDASMKKQRLVAGLALCCLVLVAVQPLSGQGDKGEKGLRSKAKVYVYPKKLTAKDKLSFGPGKEQKETIPIKGETTLIYVDLAPQARFAHDTQCILVSTNGARVVKGSWWMILNGEDLFRDGKDFKVEFPIGLSGK
jgi:hypothetical protein